LQLRNFTNGKTPIADCLGLRSYELPELTVKELKYVRDVFKKIEENTQNGFN